MRTFIYVCLQIFQYRWRSFLYTVYMHRLPSKDCGWRNKCITLDTITDVERPRTWNNKFVLYRCNMIVKLVTKI